MKYAVLWTPNALEDLQNVVNFLETEWSSKERIRFIRKLDSKLTVLSHFPEIGLASQKIAGVRRILITKHNALYYTLFDKSLYWIFLTHVRIRSAWVINSKE